MEFKVDELLKNKIQKIRYNKQKWSKIRCIDTFLYIFAIYVSLFSIFYVVSTPTFSLFYGQQGNITVSGRILTFSIISIGLYLLLYIPHLAVHLFLLYKTGKDVLTRRKEKMEIIDDTIVKYTYYDLFNKDKKVVMEMKMEDIEKISYLEEIKKFIIVGKNKLTTYNGKTNNIEKEEDIDTFDLYAYFKPDFLKELERRDIRIEINFCLR